MNRIFATVDLDRLQNNFNLLKNNTRSICVVKADAYGHGAEKIVSAIDGAFSFAVSSLNEALPLSKSAKAPIIILGDGYPPEFYDAVQNNIIISIGSYENAAKLDAVSRKMKRKARAVLCVNTGMNRDGFYFDDTFGITKALSLENIDIIGMYTHPPRGNDEQFVKYQRRCLLNLKKMTGNLGKDIFFSFENSGIRPTGEFIPRIGISLYGLRTDGYVCHGILPIMSLRAVVLSVRRVKKGEFVGYGIAFRAERDIICATVSAGYADGIPYAISNCGAVIINGKRANIIGNVCMDMLMVDVTKIKCATGDIATLIGEDGAEKITIDEVACLAGTINYEVSCGISKRVPRIYIGGEK